MLDLVAGDVLGMEMIQGEGLRLRPVRKGKFQNRKKKGGVTVELTKE
jgi:hypothetical protein